MDCCVGRRDMCGAARVQVSYLCLARCSVLRSAHVRSGLLALPLASWAWYVMAAPCSQGNASKVSDCACVGYVSSAADSIVMNFIHTACISRLL